MPITTSRARVFAMVLAAGAATRFGANKQIADFEGEPMVRRAVQLASTVCQERTLLVLGHEWQAVYAACKPLAGAFVINTEHTSGIGTSIATGVAAIRHAADAVLVVLADQPLVTARHLTALQTSWSGKDCDIVASSYADTTGVPALFPSGCFDHLCALAGDKGAQALLSDSGYSVQTVEFADAAMDIDTPADLVKSVSIARN